MADQIINRVEQSGIITLDLEDMIPSNEVDSIDIKDQLFHGLMLKEKDFRGWIKENDWSVYQNKVVALYCSADAIVPTWAYMLVSTALKDYTKDIYFCRLEELNALVAERALSNLVPEDYTDKRVVIKGCGEREISNHAYVLITSKLLPYAKTIMYGEPCSTVPVYKKRK